MKQQTKRIFNLPGGYQLIDRTPGKVIYKGLTIDFRTAKADEIEKFAAKTAYKQLHKTNKSTLGAAEVVASINAAQSVEEVKSILGSDERFTVKKAAESKIGKLKADNVD